MSSAPAESRLQPRTVVSARETVIVIPVYNEAARLNTEALLAFLSGNADTAFCFVDDGSRDGTVALLETLRVREPARITILQLPENRGKAEAVRHGIAWALEGGSTFACFADADLSAPLEEIAALRAELQQHPDAWAAFGSRVKLLGRRIIRSETRHYLGRLFATCASIALSLPVYDTQCGLKMFRNVPAVQEAFATPFRSRWIFDVELLARLARSAGDAMDSRVREVPLEHWEERGHSRLRVKDFLVAPLELMRIRREYRRSGT